MARWWTLESAAASFFLSLRLENDVDDVSSWKMDVQLWNEKKSFGDFWHIKNDFAILNATNIIFKAEKAQS
jgi:hypothetical protein